MLTILEALAAQALSDVVNFLSSIQKLLFNSSEYKVSLIVSPKLEQSVTMETTLVPGSSGVGRWELWR